MSSWAALAGHASTELSISALKIFKFFFIQLNVFAKSHSSANGIKDYFEYHILNRYLENNGNIEQLYFMLENLESFTESFETSKFVVVILK